MAKKPDRLKSKAPGHLDPVHNDPEYQHLTAKLKTASKEDAAEVEAMLEKRVEELTPVKREADWESLGIDPGPDLLKPMPGVDKYDYEAGCYESEKGS